MSKLTTKQQDRLDECELVITQHEEGFLKVADALSEIRDENLWQEKYVSFEAYCQERWGWSSRRARQIIQSAETVRQIEAKIEGKTGVGQSMSKVGSMLPGISERTAHELSKVEPEKQIKVLKAAAVNGAPITAKVIKETAAIKEAAKPKPATTEEPEVFYDYTGYPVPAHRVELFKRGEEVKKLMSKISEVRSVIRREMDSGKNADILFAHTSLSTLMSELNAAYSSLKTAIPWVVCPDCQGQRSGPCMSCKGRGFLSEHVWDSTVCREHKQLRAATVAAMKKDK